MNTIVVVRLGRLGDTILTGPTIKNLRFLYPGSKILFVTRNAYRPLAENLPGVDHVLPFPDNGSYFDLVRLSTEIDDFEPSLIVDLHKNFRSFHLATLTKAPYKVVYHKRRKERLAAVNDKKFVSPVPHTVDLYNGVIGQLQGEQLARLPDLRLPEEVLVGSKAVRGAVAMVPGASSPVKAWPTERFARLAERIISDFKLEIRLFLGEGEADLKSFFDHLPPEYVTVYHNHPVVDIASLIAQCHLTVTNDSGLMHLSSAAGTPTVALFGPTHEQLGFYPRGLHDVVFSTAETCRPCSLHGNKPCYREEQYCFTLLTVDSIYDKIASILDRVRLRPGVFIDRDGTLIEDKHYLADPGKIRFLPGSLEAVRRLQAAGYKVVIISNQSGVARAFFPIETVDLVHNQLRRQMSQAGCEPDDIRFCPHHPDGDDPDYTGDCECRKPKGGMLEAAAVNLGIDIKRSFVIGDKYSDVLCGKVVGGLSILVRTGAGSETEQGLPSDTHLTPYHICDDLAAAAEYILSRQ